MVCSTSAVPAVPAVPALWTPERWSSQGMAAERDQGDENGIERWLESGKEGEVGD